MDGNQEVLSASALTLKLKDGNYLLWKLQFEQFLSSQLLLGHVIGAMPRPLPMVSVRQDDVVTDEVNPEFNKWMQKDQLILAWLYGTLSEDALKRCLACTRLRRSG